ncbi:MAG TPA: hypothetical protein VHW01_14785 [Polyangiaceae bacterium]|nr:hypothetical protein [Polyangiaceae bacterium]
MSAELEAARFPRAAVVLEATRIAEALRAGADQLETLAAEAHRFELGTLLRLFRASLVETVTAAVEAEAGET